MRWGTVAAVAAASAVGAGAAALLAGRAVSEIAVRPRRPGPASVGGLRVHSTAAGRVALTRTPQAARRGTYALEWDGDGHAVVGDVLETTSQTVVRRLDRVDGVPPAVGTKVRLTPRVLTGDPLSALGLDYADTWVRGELGPMPAWYVPGVRDLWVIAVHGLGADRQQVLPLLPLLHGFSLPVLAVSYRNDDGAPPSPDGIGHFGQTEWRDVEAAIGLALDSGARHLVLYGWSLGATMALQAAARSSWRDAVRGLVLDSPILDWHTTVRRQATRRGVPAALAELGARAAEGRAGVDLDSLDRLARGDGLHVPTLLLHGPGDTVAPWRTSQRLAERYEDLVTLHTVQGAEHAAMWNADPDGYEEALRRFLTPLV
ncbi:alpha/beta hydrolase family protein [Streptomyces sp. NPDC092296]|uniref:alpha/beta hydrolase family protein n=1 Tax=Streptomyces sp. NPDC092296 TaxID=3366012 RepID=UPI0038148D5E